MFLSESLRKVLAALRKQGMSAGYIGNAGLAAGENPKVVRVMVAYAAGVRNTSRVNEFWGK